MKGRWGEGEFEGSFWLRGIMAKSLSFGMKRRISVEEERILQSLRLPQDDIRYIAGTPPILPLSPSGFHRVKIGPQFAPFV
jgi:hypothetical protein